MPPNPVQGPALAPSLDADRSQTQGLEHRSSQTHPVTAPQAAPMSRTGSQANAQIPMADRSRTHVRTGSQANPTAAAGRFASLVTYGEAEAAGAGPAAEPPDLPLLQSLPLTETEDHPANGDDDPDPDGERTESDEATLARKLDTIPTEPGVYLLRDAHGKVLYVGKAKSLAPARRVRIFAKAATAASRCAS